MNKRLIVVLLAAVTLIAVVVVLFYSFRQPVYTADMSEAAFRQYGLPIGPSLLGWHHADNIPSVRTGYIIMKDVQPSGSNQPLWEFALTSKRHLSEITRADLHCVYYGMNDPHGADVFGEAWHGSSICVPEGQIFFARLISERSIVYAVCLAKQGGTEDRGTMHAEYRVFDN